MVIYRAETVPKLLFHWVNSVMNVSGLPVHRDETTAKLLYHWVNPVM